MPDKQKPGPVNPITDQQNVADGSLPPLENANQETDPPDEKNAAAKNLDAVITSQAPKNKKILKTIATIAGILVLIGGVGTGIFLLSQQQEIRIRAWDCSKYVFEVKRDGTVEARNGSRRNEPGQKAEVRINNELVATCDVPALNTGGGGKICQVEVPDSGNFCWKVKGSRDCDDDGCYQETPTPSEKITICHATGQAEGTTKYTTLTLSRNAVYGTGGHFNENGTPQAGHEQDYMGPCVAGETPTPTLTPPVETPTPKSTNTPTPTSTPSPAPTVSEEVVAQCIEIQVYDENWNLLTSDKLTKLSAGDNIKIAVVCSAATGDFDMARFTINHQVLPETTNKKPGTNDFYIDYQIPEGVTTFSISVEVHHTELDWF